MIKTIDFQKMISGRQQGGDRTFFVHPRPITRTQQLFLKIHIHIRVRQRKNSTKNMGTRIKDFLPGHQSGSRTTHEMQPVNDDSVPCWIWRNKGVSGII
jgi:hypothetical protein